MKTKTAKEQFNEIYSSESDAIFRFCLLRTADRECALDLTQETFLRLWNTLLQEKEIQNHRAFLFTVARNLVIDFYRKKKTLSIEALSEESPNEEFVVLQDGSEIAQELETEARFLLGKLKELDPLYQQVVYLRFVEGILPKDIAEILGISPNAVSVRISRGIEQLREITGYSQQEE